MDDLMVLQTNEDQACTGNVASAGEMYKQRLKLEASQGSVKLYSARSIQVWGKKFFFNIESFTRPQQRQEGERGKKGKASETLLH